MTVAISDIIATVGALGAIGVSWRAVPTLIRRLKPYAAVSARLDNVDKTLAAQNVILQSIQSELKPNGGGSMNDAVNRIEKGLSGVKSMQRLLLETNPEAHYETDLQGLHVWANAACTKLLGFDASNLSGNGWKNCTHPDDRQMIIREWMDAVKDRRTYSLRHRLVKSTGEVIYVHSVAEPFENGWLGTVALDTHHDNH